MQTIHKEQFGSSNIKLVLLGTTEEQFAAQMAIRTNIFARWFPDLLGSIYEIDTYDSPEMPYFAVMCDEKVIGGFRLIQTSSASDLPVAKRGTVPDGPGVEISRWCIDSKVEKSLKSAAHKVMIVGGLKYLQSKNVEIAHIDVCTFLFKFLKRIGICIKSIGEKHGRSEFDPQLEEASFMPAVLNVRSTLESCTFLH